MERARSVPTCPKCGKLISPKKYRRHMERCGKTHKHPARALQNSDNFLERL
jgi:ribosomal protein L34E